MSETHKREAKLNHFDNESWLPMQDPDGRVLPKIDGKHGARGQKEDGTFIGCDFIRMQPGAGFPLHTHEGDHEIYFISGKGFVHVAGTDIPVMSGHILHIPAECPHGIWVPPHMTTPLIFIAMGHPHHPISSTERMRAVK